MFCLPDHQYCLKTLLFTVHKTQRTIHFDKIDRILKVYKNHISQNYEFKTHAQFAPAKMHVIKIQMFVSTLILLPRRMLFFEPEVLKTVWNLNNGKTFTESALYRLALVGHKKRIVIV